MLARVSFTLLLLLSALSSASFAQSSGQMSQLMRIDSNIDLGEWSGVDLLNSSIAPSEESQLCFMYEALLAENKFYLLNYNVSVTGDTDKDTFVLKDGKKKLPLSMELSPASQSKISFAINSPYITPGASYRASFINGTDSITFFDELLGGGDAYITNTPCQDGKFDLKLIISASDILSLKKPSGTFTGSFALEAERANLFGNGSIKEYVNFDISITINSSIYLTQLPNEIKLNHQTQTDFCVWSFGGKEFTLDLTAANSPHSDQYNFSLAQESNNEFIGYDISLFNHLTGQQFTSVSNPVIVPNLEAEDKSNADCSGSNGLNMGLSINHEPIINQTAGTYTDTITITVSEE